jgi:hypothetical protein
MPCCNRLVNDSIIRDTLVREGLKCPFCNTPRISPESVSALLPHSSLFPALCFQHMLTPHFRVLCVPISICDLGFLSFS